MTASQGKYVMGKLVQSIAPDDPQYPELKKRNKYPKVENPWGLLPGEAAIMDAMCRLGCGKLVAKDLGIPVKTVNQHCWSAAQKMGTLGTRTRIMKFLIWDRFRRKTLDTKS